MTTRRLLGCKGLFISISLLADLARDELVASLGDLLPTADLPLLSVGIREGAAVIGGFGVGVVFGEQHEAVFIVVLHFVFLLFSIARRTAYRILGTQEGF